MPVYLVTFEEMPAGDVDDQQLIPELEALGISAQFVIWDDPTVDWSKADLAVIRSTWDYFLKYPDFLHWLDTVSRQTRLMNPVETIKWNLHKAYQQELIRQGVRCVETVWVRENTSMDITELIKQHHWNRFVIKPAISAASYATRRFTINELQQAQQHLNTFGANADMMIQPYLKSFDTQGETSLMFFNRVFSHAVQRQAALNASDPLSGYNELITVPESAIQFAHQILSLIDADLLFARVDISLGENHDHTLLELELVEPSLFLSYCDGAASKFVRVIADQVR